MLPQHSPSSSPTRPGPLYTALKKDESEGGSIRRASSTISNRPKTRYSSFLAMFTSSNNHRQPLLPNESIIASLLCFEDSHATIEQILNQIRDPSEESAALCSLAALLEHHNIAAPTLSKILKSDLSSSKDASHMCLRGDGAAIGLLSRYLSHVCVKFLDKALRKTVTRICERTKPLEPAEVVEQPATSWMSFLSQTNSAEAVAQAIRTTASPEKRRRKPQSMVAPGSGGSGSSILKPLMPLISSSQQQPTTDSITADQLDVHQLTTTFLESLQQAVDLLPVPVQVIVKAIEEACQLVPRKGLSRRDTPKLLAVASTVFLRFLTPAIVDPTLYGIVSSAAKDRSSKNLVVFAKHIQSLIGRTMDTDPAAHTKEQKLLVHICDAMLSRSLPRWKAIQLNASQYQQHSRYVVDYLKRNKDSLSVGSSRLRTIIQNMIEQDDFDSFSERSIDDDDSSGSALSVSSETTHYHRHYARDLTAQPSPVLPSTSGTPPTAAIAISALNSHSILPEESASPSISATPEDRPAEPLSSSSTSVPTTRTPSGLSTISSQFSGGLSDESFGSKAQQEGSMISSPLLLSAHPIRKSNSKPLGEHGRAYSESTLTIFSSELPKNSGHHH